MPSPKSLLKAFESLIVDKIGLGISPIILNVKLAPKQIIDKIFSIEFQTQDSNKDRGKDRLRLTHEVLISYVNILNVHNQSKVRYDSLDIEEQLIKELLIKENLPEYRVTYKSTNRTLSANRDFYLTSILINVEHYWELEN